MHTWDQHCIFDNGMLIATNIHIKILQIQEFITLCLKTHIYIKSDFSPYLVQSYDSPINEDLHFVQISLNSIFFSTLSLVKAHFMTNNQSKRFYLLLHF